ncbi:MAG TPA: DUF4330 family protein [Tissierellales bacterium]|nr:DUF4330 family protein [Tissierellales bacterium]
MKIINEKGKLFGVINIIDLIVIIILVLIVGGGVKRAKAKPEVVGEKGKALITIEISDVKKPIADGFDTGQNLYFQDKDSLIGEIIDIDVKPYTKNILSGGKWHSKEVPDKYVATLTVMADVTETSEVIIVGGEEVRIGVKYKVKAKKTTASGTVFGVEVQ